MLVELEVSPNKTGVQRVRLKSDTLIGRSDDCQLRIRSKQVSRRHCRIEVSEAGVFVRDLESSNGTFVDGDRIEADVPVPLSPGSRLTVAAVTFVVWFEPPGDSASAVPHADMLRADDPLSVETHWDDTLPEQDEPAVAMPEGESAVAQAAGAALGADGDEIAERPLAFDPASTEAIPIQSSADNEPHDNEPHGDDGDPTETLADEEDSDLTWRQSPDDTVRSRSLPEDEDFNPADDELAYLDETLPDDAFPPLFDDLPADEAESKTLDLDEDALPEPADYNESAVFDFLKQMEDNDPNEEHR